MIVGIGTDQVLIGRIENSIKRFGDRFLSRVYTKSEIELARSRGFERRLAMYFAAKEAVSKSLGTGVSGFSMRDIEVSYTAKGQPVVSMHGGAREIAQQLNIQRVHLSLTDEAGIAMAFVIAEG